MDGRNEALRRMEERCHRLEMRLLDALSRAEKARGERDAAVAGMEAWKATAHEMKAQQDAIRAEVERLGAKFMAAFPAALSGSPDRGSADMASAIPPASSAKE